MVHWIIGGEDARDLCRIFFNVSRKEGDPEPAICDPVVNVVDTEHLLRITASDMDRSSALNVGNKDGNIWLEERNPEEHTFTTTYLLSDGRYIKSSGHYEVERTPDRLTETFSPMEILASEATHEEKEAFINFAMFNVLPKVYALQPDLDSPEP